MTDKINTGSIEFLDEVLKNTNTYFPRFQNIEQIREIFKEKNIELSVHEVWQALYKLDKDGYIFMIGDNEKLDTIKACCLFDGKIFIKNGGYIKSKELKEKKDDDENYRKYLHYAYYTIATLALIIALTTKGCNTKGDCSNHNYHHFRYHNCIK